MNIGLHGGSCGHSCCLRISDLSVKIGNHVILENITVHAHCGEMIALVGPNGCQGKVEVNLTDEEEALLKKSADTLKGIISQIQI